jgi:antitoxin YefM
MRIISATALRENLAEHLARVGDDREVLHVTRQGGRTVVIIDEGEYEAIMETLHLLRSPANAKALLEAIAQADAGELTEFDPTAR